MFLQINKHLIPTNPEKVLDNKTWESQIPKRPSLRLYDKGEEEEKKPLATTRMSPFKDDLLFLRRCRRYKIHEIAA